MVLRLLIVFTSEMNKFIIHSASDFELFLHLLDHNCKQTIRLLNDHGLLSRRHSRTNSVVETKG